MERTCNSSMYHFYKSPQVNAWWMYSSHCSQYLLEVGGASHSDSRYKPKYSPLEGKKEKAVDFICNTHSVNLTQAHRNIPELLHGDQNQLHQNDPHLGLLLLLNACASEQLLQPPATGTSKYTVRKWFVMEQSY